jgi:DNA polymerase-3 subunit delta'
MKVAAQGQNIDGDASSRDWAAGLIGNQDVVDVLKRAVSSGRLAHAYLFVGAEGAGKVTVARRFATHLLGVNNLDTHPDFTFVERERDAKTGKLHAAIALEQVQALTGRLSRGALMNGWRVAILDGAQLLNKESANALLKTLEEPHEKTMLLLTATSTDDVLATIRSRCQVIRFARVAGAEISGALVRRGITPAQADLFARVSGGRPGIAVSYAQDPASLDDLFARRDTILSMSSAAIADRFAAIERAVPPKLPFQDAIDHSRDWLDLLAELLRDALLLRHGIEDRIVHVDARDRIVAWSARFDPAAVLAMLEVSRRMLDANVAPRAALDRLVAAF